MKVTLEPTSRVIGLVVDGVRVPGRVWQGHTANGIEVVAIITRIACSKEADQSELAQALAAQAEPNTAALEAFPMRMVL